MDDKIKFEVINIQEDEVFEFVTEEVANDEEMFVLCEEDEQNTKSDSQNDGKITLFIHIFFVN